MCAGVQVRFVCDMPRQTIDKITVYNKYIQWRMDAQQPNLANALAIVWGLLRTIHNIA